MNRLQELLSKDLTRGRDDAELDELQELLDKYRRNSPGTWQRCDIDGQPAWKLELDCGHNHIIEGEEPPRPGIVVDEAGTVHRIPLTIVCESCYRAKADA